MELLKLSRQLEQELDGGAPADQLLGGLRRYSARLGSPGNARPLLAMDAVCDLLPVFASQAKEILLPAARYLNALPARQLFPEWLERAPLAESPVVFAGSLDEILEAPDLESAGSRVARLLSVMQSTEAFLELVLETAARQVEPSGLPLIEANATVRAMAGQSWNDSREFLFRLIESFHGAHFAPLGVRRSGEPEATPYEAAYWLAASGSLELRPLCLFLAHAFQAERYCQARKRWVRAGIQKTLRAWLPTLESLPRADLPRPVPEPARETGPWAVSEDDGRNLAAAIAGRDAEAAVGRGARLLGVHADPDPLFRWIAVPALQHLEQGDPDPLLLVQGARWGVHLLKTGREELLGRLLREMAST